MVVLAVHNEGGGHFPRAMSVQLRCLDPYACLRWSDNSCLSLRSVLQAFVFCHLSVKRKDVLSTARAVVERTWHVHDSYSRSPKKRVFSAKLLFCSLSWERIVVFTSKHCTSTRASPCYGLLRPSIGRAAALQPLLLVVFLVCSKHIPLKSRWVVF